MFIEKRYNRVHILMRQARGYEDPHYYIDAVVLDKYGERKETICSHYLVGIVGLSQDCDYTLNKDLVMRFTKFHYITLRGNQIVACANVMILSK